jgi:hypothetical protein
MKLTLLLLLLPVALVAAGGAQASAAVAPPAPRVVNGQLETHAAAGDLAAQIASFVGPAWVGYRVAVAVPGRCQWCCDEPKNGKTAFLEGEREAFIVVRTNGRLSVLSPSCEIDLGGLTLHWIDGVSSTASLAFLKGLLVQPPKRRTAEVVSAIAAHADPVADEFLFTTAERSEERDARDRAAYWLAATRGAPGLAVVKRLAQSDPDHELRSRLMSALAQAPEFTGTPFLMEAATRDADRRVRERAFFWLGRSKDPRAERFIDGVLAR